jgi:hypothetical protein
LKYLEVVGSLLVMEPRDATAVTLTIPEVRRERGRGRGGEEREGER